jgi:hypothetical protein
MATGPRHTNELVSPVALWFGILGGPLAWAARLLLSYPLVGVACAQGAGLVLHLVAGVTLAVTVAAGLVAWRGFRTTRDWQRSRPPRTGEPTVDAWAVERTYFMALLGLLSSGLFALVIVAEWFTVFVTDPCVIR